MRNAPFRKRSNLQPLAIVKHMIQYSDPNTRRARLFFQPDGWSLSRSQLEGSKAFRISVDSEEVAHHKKMAS